MNAYYNEHDAYPAQWLRNLSDAGHITAGRVDARSIKELSPDDIKKATRAHFFAGIGGWDYALQLAGWPADAEVWTGSCPCQPFSNAGKGKGIEDDRHLWPVWFDLIESCRPAVIFGEQVVSPAGRVWWDAVSTDLEGLGYSARAFDLCAAGVGAPHIRQRLFWVGNANDERPQGRSVRRDSPDQRPTWPAGVDDTGGQGSLAGQWSGADWLYCRDGKRRPVESGTQPLADGLPGRVGQLRAYGNAIVPQAAAVLIRATMEAIH